MNLFHPIYAWDNIRRFHIITSLKESSAFMSFALGQRWISDTESDLGLGTVIQLSGRTVSLVFPATGETRLFSKEDAPLTRVIFNKGDEVQGPDTWLLQITHIETTPDELVVYQGIRNDTNEEVTLLETQLHYNIRFNKPQDRLFAGQIDRLNRFSTRYQSRLQQHDTSTNPHLGMLGARIGLITHQLWIAHEVGNRHAPRVLLADEVGLGKTIEAGMIIHQQLLTGRAQRVLIVVPDSLQHQWLVEMLRRFNLHFSMFDEERCIEAFADHDNPFETEQLILCSMSLLRKKRRFEQVLDAEWDLLIVDEAHHLEWHPEKPSRPYQLIQALAEEIPGVLLLTATPEQLGHESHFARLRLLDPDRFFDYDTFVQEEKQYEQIADVADVLLKENDLSSEQQAFLEQKLPEHDLEQLRNHTTENRHDVYQAALKHLVDQHGTGRILFRNSRTSVQGFKARHLHAHELAIPKEYETSARVAEIMNPNRDIKTKAHDALTPEKLYQDFEADATHWWNIDPRVQWLLDFLKNNKSKKVLIIASSAATALSLEEALRLREGIRATVFHEGMSILERDKAGAYFAQQEAGAQALICSEIGSEGRNFQFANQLVLFDLPLNPDLLEQRIGRLDRIGQKHDINIHVPYFKNTAQESLLHWYHQGLNAFEKTCPSGQQLYQEFETALFGCLSSDPEHSFDELISMAQLRYKTLSEMMEQGRDKLLEMNSHGGHEAKLLVEQLKSNDDKTSFVHFILRLWDILGVQQEDKGEQTIILKPSEQMLFPYPGIPDDGITITFDRTTALSRDDVTFVTPEHPLIATGLDLILSSETGTTSVALLKNKALPVGTIFLEMMFVADVSAPKETQVFRYFPATPVRILMDQQGNSLTEKVSFETLNSQLAPVNRHTAIKLINASQTTIHPLLSKGQEFAKEAMLPLKQQALQNAQEQLTNELDRLKQLKQVNPSIRQEEIDHLEQQQQTVTHYIEQSQLTLDAVRVIFVSHQ